MYAATADFGSAAPGPLGAGVVFGAIEPRHATRRSPRPINFFTIDLRVGVHRNLNPRGRPQQHVFFAHKCDISVFISTLITSRPSVRPDAGSSRTRLPLPFSASAPALMASPRICGKI